jgi:hypothetical protein
VELDGLQLADVLPQMERRRTHARIRVFLEALHIRQVLLEEQPRPVTWADTPQSELPTLRVVRIEVGWIEPVVHAQNVKPDLPALSIGQPEEAGGTPLLSHRRSSG